MVGTHTLLAAQGGPPQSPQRPPDVVWMEIWGWLQNALWVVLAIMIATVIIFGAMMALDKDRGEPVSATSPVVRATRFLIGGIIATLSVQIVAFLV